jgi:hypothetical protein
MIKKYQAAIEAAGQLDFVESKLKECKVLMKRRKTPELLRLFIHGHFMIKFNKSLAHITEERCIAWKNKDNKRDIFGSQVQQLLE